MRKFLGLIHIDEKRRDVLPCLYLAELLRRRGMKVILSNRRTTEALLDRLIFDFIVLPVYAVAGGAERFRQITPRTLIYMLPTEGALLEDEYILHKYTGFRYVNEEKRGTATPFVKRAFIWGDHVRKKLAKYPYFTSEQLVVTGSPRTQFLQRIEERANRGVSLPVGFCSRMVTMNSYLSISCFEYLDGFRGLHRYYYDADRNLEDYMWIEYAQARLALEFLDICEKYKIKVKYRPHPRENFKSYEYVRKRYGNLIDFSEAELPFELWLNKISCMVSFNSTTFYEAIMAGIPAITLTTLLGERLHQHTTMADSFNYPIRNYVYNPTGMEDVAAQINKIRASDFSAFDYKRSEVQTILNEMYQPCNGTPPLEQVAAIIEKDLKEAQLPGAKTSTQLKAGFVASLLWFRNFLRFRALRQDENSADFLLTESAVRREFLPFVRELQQKLGAGLH